MLKEFQTMGHLGGQEQMKQQGHTEDSDVDEQISNLRKNSDIGEEELSLMTERRVGPAEYSQSLLCRNKNGKYVFL
jgi:hypothetical protein